MKEYEAFVVMPGTKASDACRPPLHSPHYSNDPSPLLWPRRDQISFKKIAKVGARCSSSVEHLASMCRILGSVLGTVKQPKQADSHRSLLVLAVLTALSL